MVSNVKKYLSRRVYNLSATNVGLLTDAELSEVINTVGLVTT